MFSSNCIEMTPIEQQKAAAQFAKEWQGKGYEKGHTQPFWLELLQKVFGVADPYNFIKFEEQVMVDNTNFMDGHIDSTKVLIEQKGIDKDLGKGIKQSNGEILTPFLQARKYIVGLPVDKHPRWVVTCNFREFWVYDMNKPNDEPQKILLENLGKEYERLSFLVDAGNAHTKREEEVSFKAGRLVGQIYDLLLKQYIEPDSPETLRSLNILCVRLVFLLYAEDAHLFGKRTAFHDYLEQYKAKDIRRALIDLFQVLDTDIPDRDPYMDDTLKAFPYVNGGLFSEEHIIIPQFTDELKELILAKASDDFDWSEISPTIFGAVFESTLNPETRRSGGMHYTSIENIHKVIDPLFLNALKEEFGQIKQIAQERQQRQRLDAFQDKLASLTFFDPACGSGNFLTESYLSLRRLENEVIALREKGQSVIGDFANPIKVDIHQFYGIEINDFAVSVATTALWIAEQQMLQETEKIASFQIKPLPLKAYHNIKEGNALRIDWSEVIDPDRLNYIIGNPPFVGASMMSAEQKNDAVSVFGKIKLSNSIDFVGAWYHLAAQMMQVNASVRAALVSTNSITQGEQVAALWQPLYKRYGIHIDFAYRTFRWDSEADIKAHVHCVIIGFSKLGNSNAKTLYLSDNQIIKAYNINPYLIDAPDVLVESRAKPICDIPYMYLGNKPTDDGNFILTREEKEEILRKEPALSKYIHPYIGAVEFINNKVRYCFWLKDISPAEIKNSQILYERVQNVKTFREASTSPATRQKACVPHEFFFISQPTTNYLIVPSTSSENRRYVPIGFLSPDTISSNANTIVPNASLYHFGVLTSNVHMAWMRVVCGRLKSDYRYSGSIVYNNFPWCEPTDEQKAKIEQTAQAILDARAKYPECSLADLYDDVTMPPELRKAHQDNDRAVMQAYGFIPGKTTESECVAKLFELYQELVSKK